MPALYCLRHKEALACGMGALLTFLYRHFELDGAPLPDIATKEGLEDL